MPLKQQKKTAQKKDSKTELELTIQSAINSNYSLIMPVVDQTIIHIKDPVSKLMYKFKVDSKEYFEFLDTMIDYGLMVKLDKDFQEVFKYAPAYTESWNKYKAKKETTIVN
jgi:hypothetical protein